MSAFEEVKGALKAAPRTWLLTGAAGFIGSHLLETLLKLDQRVVGLDNFSTGRHQNLEEVRGLVSASQWAQFRLVEGDLSNLETCRRVCAGVELISHQAALGSVPRSFADPLACHQSNVTGCLNLLVAARDAGVRRLVYVSSSAVYGDDPSLPKVEERVGKPLSPYAATKVMNELYAEVFARAYGLGCIGLRCFNVFGPRQDPNGAYAAVISQWTTSLLQGRAVHINGDGETSRDFCYVENVVQANLLAATVANPAALNQVYNIALGERTTLNRLFESIQQMVRRRRPDLPQQKPIYRDFRPGDLRHSLADISKAQRLLGYAPTHRNEQGLEAAVEWYVGQARGSALQR